MILQNETKGSSQPSGRRGPKAQGRLGAGRLALLLTALLALAHGGVALATVRYVKTNGTTTAANAASATSWATACPDLQRVINASAAGDEVWVAAGTYTPKYSASGWSWTSPPTATSTTNRHNAFVMKPGVKVYGGFSASSPEATVAARATVISSGVTQMSNATILSGEINTTAAIDNCYHVVVAAGDMKSSGGYIGCLDGFTVRDGYSTSASGSMTVNGVTINHSDGGGVYVTRNFTLQHLYVYNNKADYGGGLHLRLGDIVVSNVIVNSNTAGYRGGGLYISANAGDKTYPCTITQSRFTSNTCSYSGTDANYGGGGIFDYSTNKSGATVFKDIVVSGNTTRREGGGMNIHAQATITNAEIRGNKAGTTTTAENGWGGGIYLYCGRTDEDHGCAIGASTLTNVLIAGNWSAREGGGVRIKAGSTNNKFINVTISGNYSPTAGGGIDAANQTIFYNSILYNNASTNGTNTNAANYSGAFTFNSSLRDGTDPKFKSAASPPGASGSPITTGDYHLTNNSTAAINKGDNVQNSTDVDLDGIARKINTTIDLGAYEYPSTAPAVTTATASGVTSTAAILGGNLTQPVGVSDYGIVYSTTSSTPTIDNGTKLSKGASGASSSSSIIFSFNVEGLVPNATYYFRTYASSHYYSTVYGEIRSFNLSKIQLTIGAPTVTTTKTYDGSTTATVTALGAVSGKNSSYPNVTVTATANYNSKTAGTGKTIIVTYTLSGTDKDKYIAPASYPTSGVINKKTLTVTGAAVNNKVYDRTTTATFSGTPALSGVVSGDAVTLAKGTPTFADKNVGAGKAITFNFSISGSDAASYALTQPTGVTASITVKTLTVTNTAVSNKVYDGTTTATFSGTPAQSGVVSGDAVTLSKGTPTFADKKVGNNKPITFTAFSLSGADAASYSLTQPTGVTASITAKPLTVTNTAVSNKVYDGSDSATFTNPPALSGVVSGDAVTLANGTPKFADKNVGADKPITFNFSISGADVAGYSLTQPTGVTASVSARQLVIGSVHVAEKIYDGTDSARVDSVQFANLVPGEKLLLGTDYTVDSAAFDSADAGVSIQER
ncbi:MAG: YDG domain-containing protein [Prevotellaceae bacterium]|jgi:hypothetical protein|nr:YDG domain-containing protein [Prevotellaceae bacterium]